MQSVSVPYTLIAFLLVIGPLIFVHEMGHYLVGRWFGVKAETFSIGFGREIGGWTDKRGTRWKVGWMPLGGYVKFAGDMNPASVPDPDWLNLPPEERNQTFQAKPVWQRFLIVFAGPAINFLFAILIFMALFAMMGRPMTPPVIGAVQERSAAAAAGIQVGDRIARIAGREVRRFEDISSIVMIRPNQPLEIDLVRNNRTFTVTATPQPDVQRDRFGNEFRRGLLGVERPAPVIETVPWYRLPGAAAGHTVDTVVMMVETLGQVITGRRSVKELGGPLKIAQFSGQQATLGLIAFFGFMALVSINLGFINLLPIPLLDGGHLLFYTIEGVRRKPLKPETQEWAFRTGLAALLALMIFVTFNDLASFGLFQRLGGLIG
ncbi:MAG TPA: RIP metalloprotease RseP [Allosphingosinicella sp.]|jgi:regulator of sigma E protease|nr:RIP metalloprotease RseP [Allosphingosinicella sp.]